MQERTCTIEGCDKPHRARGLCAAHWNATYRKDQHREVPCAVCGTMVVKNAPGIKRRSVERRIVELEDALQALAPDHPILKHVSIPRGSGQTLSLIHI